MEDQNFLRVWGRLIRLGIFWIIEATFAIAASFQVAQFGERFAALVLRSILDHKKFDYDTIQCMVSLRHMRVACTALHATPTHIHDVDREGLATMAVMSRR